MVNCNPETVSTDYDTSDRLYFEPLTVEDVIAVVERERPLGVVAQFGGQTPLKLARAPGRGGRPDPRHEPGGDRPGRGPRALRRPAATSSGCSAPEWAIANDVDEAVVVAERIGYPGARAPLLRARRPRDAHLLRRRPRCARAPGEAEHARRPVRRGRDRDRRRRGRATVRTCWSARVMQHVEEAGIHSGDSSCVIPPLSLGPELEAEIRRQTVAARPRPRRARAGQRAVRAARGTTCTCSRRTRARAAPCPSSRRRPGSAWSTSPAGWRAASAWRTSAPVVAEADRPWRSRRSCCRSCASPAPTRARARDALDRRGDGARARLRHRLRQGGARRRQPAARRGRDGRVPQTRSSRSAIATSRRPRCSPHSLHELGFRLHATPGTARAIEQLGLPVSLVAKVSAREARERRRRRSST